MRTRPLLRGLGTLAAAGAACVAYGTLVERRWFRLRREILPGALRPTATQSLRILLVSDLHLNPPDTRLERFIARLGDLDVDLVVAAGDLLGEPEAVDPVVDMLSALTRKGTPGLAVLGANDFYGPTRRSYHHYFTSPDERFYGEPLDTDRLRKGLTATGWTLLENERTTVETRAGLVEAAGLVDPHMRHLPLASISEIEPIEPAAVLRLGLVHAPYLHALDLLTEAGYHTILAAHTHGGQVRIPPFGALVTNCDLPADRARGTSRLDGDGWLHVSAGLGQSEFAPFRFACRPEASHLELLP